MQTVKALRGMRENKRIRVDTWKCQSDIGKLVSVLHCGSTDSYNKFMGHILHLTAGKKFFYFFPPYSASTSWVVEPSFIQEIAENALILRIFLVGHILRQSSGNITLLSVISCCFWYIELHSPSLWVCSWCVVSHGWWSWWALNDRLFADAEIVAVIVLEEGSRLALCTILT